MTLGLAEGALKAWPEKGSEGEKKKKKKKKKGGGGGGGQGGGGGGRGGGGGAAVRKEGSPRIHRGAGNHGLNTDRMKERSGKGEGGGVEEKKEEEQREE